MATPYNPEGYNSRKLEDLQKELSLLKGIAALMVPPGSNGSTLTGVEKDEYDKTLKRISSVQEALDAKMRNVVNKLPPYGNNNSGKNSRKNNRKNSRKNSRKNNRKNNRKNSRKNSRVY